MKKLLLILFAAFGAQQLLADSIHADLVPAHFEGISKAFRDVPEVNIHVEKQTVRKEHENESLEHPFEKLNPNALPQGPDPALQRGELSKSSTAVVTSAVLSNWTGLTASVQPSDNCIAVGPNHVVQMTNASTSTFIRIWDKSGNVLVSSRTVQSITGITDYGDPNILYDQAADRYVFVVLYSSTASILVVCVSQTADPAGAYYTYTFNTANGFPDYPKIGVWNNTYFITTNSTSPTVYCLDRAKLLAGQPITGAQMFAMNKFPRIGFQAAAPITLTGSTAAAGAKPTVIRVGDDAWGTSVGPDHLELFEMTLDWSNASNSVMTGPVNLNTLPYDSKLCAYGSMKCIPQPKGTKLDPLSDIIMDKPQYRNFGTWESLVCSHVCNADAAGTAGVRWYELRRTPGGAWSIYQQGTFSPSTDSRWMSSITENAAGTIALGYNISSTSLYPGMRFTGRDTCSALNLMTAPEVTVKSGTAANSSSRYGDYNAMVTDPADGSFWFTANYNPTSNWATNVVHFTLTSCGHGHEIAVQSGMLGLGEPELVPNPTSGRVKVSFYGPAGETRLSVSDLSGKLVFAKQIDAVEGDNAVELETELLPTGCYLVNVSSGGGSVNARLLVTHD